MEVPNAPYKESINTNDDCLFPLVKEWHKENGMEWGKSVDQFPRNHSKED